MHLMYRTIVAILCVVNKHAVRWSMSTVMPKNIYIRIATLAKNQSLIVIPQQHRKMYIRVVRGASMCTDEGSGYYWR